MSVQENNAIARRFWSYDPEQEVADELLAEGFVNHSPAPGFAGDKSGYKQLLASYYRAFPGHTVTVDDLIGHGDKVAVCWTVRGTHQRELMGIPPTGNEIEVTGTTIQRIAGGKIVEQWEVADRLTMMQQLGVIPSPEEAPA